MSRQAKILLLAVLLLLPATAYPESRIGSRMKLYFKEAFLPHLWYDTKTTFTEPKNWGYLAAGGALSVVAHQYDWQVNDYYKDHELAWGMAEFGNDWWGEGIFQGVLALSIMTGGYHYQNEEVASAGEALLEAQLIQGAIINIIKPIAHKERPNESSYKSFPSGHTGTAFCTAAVLHDRFGWKLGAPAYTFAVITGLARMDVQAHWVSDVVMGATIAMVTGYSVSQNYDPYPYKVRFHEADVLAMPLYRDDKYGMAVAASW
ncbi:MAG: phosphatase PAP2 family protein [bacterium]